MNKKGFTLTELLAVIIILGVLIGIGVTSYINIKNNSLEKQKENVISYLKTKAMNYADKTGITTVNVDTLIKEGYVDADDGSDIYDPVTKESMNCYIIESAYENGEYKESKVTEDKKENNVCKEYEITSELIEICKITAGGLCETLDGNWTNEDITLGVRYKTGNSFSAETTYEWQGTDGKSGNEKVIEVTTEEGTVNTSRYQVKIVDNDIHGVASKFIRIDKQAPGINKIDIEHQNEWTKENKKISIEATDYNGSGIDKYFISTNSSCNTESSQTNEIGNGTYYLCVSDKVGNKSEIKEINITKVDTKPDKPILSASDGVASGVAHTSGFNIEINKNKNPYASSGKEAGASASNVHYEYYTSKNSTVQRVNGNSIAIGIDAGKLTYYVRACNEVEDCSEYASYEAVTSFTVTVNVTGGTSNPKSRQIIYNTSGTFTITANSGYVFTSAEASCNGEATATLNGTTLTVSNVTKNQACTVKLKQYYCPVGTLSGTTCVASALSEGWLTTSSYQCKCQQQPYNCTYHDCNCGYSYSCWNEQCCTETWVPMTTTYNCHTEKQCDYSGCMKSCGSSSHQVECGDACDDTGGCEYNYVCDEQTFEALRKECSTCRVCDNEYTCDRCESCSYREVNCSTCYTTTYYCASGWNTYSGSGTSLECSKTASLK